MYIFLHNSFSFISIIKDQIHPVVQFDSAGIFILHWVDQASP